MNFIVVFLLSLSIAFAADPCRFEYPGKGVIDLTTLGHTDGTPAFSYPIGMLTVGYKYTYNPCKPFTGSTVNCQNVAACQADAADPRFGVPLGDQESATWNPRYDSDENPSVSYFSTSRTAHVILHCSKNGSEAFEFIREDPAYTYTLRLTHKCACWNGCGSTPSTTTPVVTTTSRPVSDECRFVHPEKGVIDLSFIGRTDEKAAYSDETTRAVSNFKYSYNPCRSFSQGSGCIGAAVCQVSNNEQKTFMLGTQESAWWDVTSGENAVTSLNYVYGDKKVRVLIKCSEEGNNEFEAYGEDPANTFKFQLTHRCACWNRCSTL